jgi:hypothetical protein
MKFIIQNQKHNFHAKKQLAFIVLFIISINIAFSQYPPLGRSWTFGVFATVGAIDNTSNTFINNDIGTNAGAINGFPPGIVLGSIHNADSITNIVTADINFLYNYLENLTCDSSIGVGLGNNQILTPNVYCIGAASTLNDVLILDAQGDPDALFIFQINGAFASSNFSQISLINSAQPCNVFWQINGLVNLGANSSFLGTVVAAGAISMLNEAELEGRIFSIPGAINLNNNYLNMPCSEVLLSQFKIQIISKCQNNHLNIHFEGIFGDKIEFFTLEKRNSNNDWQTIAQINSNNTNTFQTYSFIDFDDKQTAKNYYRIKQFENKSMFQIIGEINNTTKCNSPIVAMRLFPNPTYNSFEITINGDEELIENITIYNYLGKVVYKAITYVSKIDIKNIEKGIYTVQILYNNQLASSKLMIN